MEGCKQGAKYAVLRISLWGNKSCKAATLESGIKKIRSDNEFNVGPLNLLC